MSMVGPAAILVGDLHARVRAPLSRKDSYFEALRKKLQHIRSAALTVNADVVVFSGDIFHDKPSSCPHEIVATLIDIFSSFPCPVVAVPGNHDLPYHSMEQLDKTPLYVLERAGAVTLVDSKHPFVTPDKSLAVYGWEYEKDPKLETVRSMSVVEARFNILAVHNFVSKFGGDFFGDVVYSVPDLVDAAPFEPHVILVGHFHNAEDPIELNPGGLVLQPGAVMRGSLVDEEVNRSPHIYVARFSEKPGDNFIQVGSGFVKYVESVLPHEPSEDVFFMEEREEAKQSFVQIQEFARSLADLQVVSDSVTGEIDLEKFDLPQDILQLARYYLEQAASENV